LVAGVHGSELADPDRRAGPAHVLRASQERLLERAAVHVPSAAHPGIVATISEPRQRVVVHRVDRVRPGLAEPVEVYRIAIAFEEQDVVGIHRAYRLAKPRVERTDHRAAGIPRLVHGIVTGNPGVAAVAPGERFPEMDRAILKMAMRPEERAVRRVVAVPAL